MLFFFLATLGWGTVTLSSSEVLLFLPIKKIIYNERVKNRDYPYVTILLLPLAALHLLPITLRALFSVLQVPRFPFIASSIIPDVFVILHVPIVLRSSDIIYGTAWMRNVGRIRKYYLHWNG